MLTYNYLKDVPGLTADVFVFLPLPLPSGSIPSWFAALARMGIVLSGWQVTGNTRGVAGVKLSATTSGARRLHSGASKRKGCTRDGDPPVGSELSFPLMCKSASTTPTQEAELFSRAAVWNSAVLVCEGTYENIFGVSFPGRFELVKIEGKH